MNALPDWLRPRRADEPVRLALGAMNFGDKTDEATAARIIARAIERGITLFDTANAYAGGRSEEILGRALRAEAGARRHDLAVATKCGFGRVSGRLEGLAPATLVRACEASLARLGLERVEIYYLHVPDYSVPLRDSIGALAALHRDGKIAAYGMSNYASWQLLEADGFAREAGLFGGTIAQQLYNLLVRQLDVEYFAFTAAHPRHTTVYNPLAGGLLASPPNETTAEPARGSRFDGNALYRRRYWSPPVIARAQRYAALAAAHGLSPAALAYGFLAARPGVDSILVGPRTMEHLDTALDALATPLPPGVLSAIDELHREDLGTDASYRR